MNKRSIILGALVLLFMSCEKDTKHLKKASNYFNLFIMNEDSLYLDSCYQEIIAADVLTDKNPNGGTVQFLCGPLLHLKKYDEIILLMDNSTNFPKYQRNYIRNLALAYKTYDDDKAKAIGYLEDNIKLVEDSISRNPQDSLIWMEYFFTRIIMVGKQQAMKEADSLKARDDTYTESFGDQVIEYLQDFPESFILQK